MIDRRTFLAGTGAVLLATPLAAGAQQAGKAPPRIGVLVPGSPIPNGLPMQAFEAFRQGLRELGYIEGRTIVIEARWDECRPERYEAQVRELVGVNADVIVAGTTASSLAAKRATATIPIVMAATGAGDPVALQLVTSLARPAGNVTGLILQTHELAGKRLELLREAVPGMTRLTFLWVSIQSSPPQIKEYEAAAQSLRLQLHSVEVSGPGDFGNAFRTAVRDRSQALIMAQSGLFAGQRARIAELALKNGLPTMSGETGYALAGGLMNYGPNIPNSWRRAATYVDKILKGVKPADLPIEQPTKFELVINLKTAKALGLTIPPSMLGRADEVIQ